MIGRLETALPVLLVDDTASTRYSTRRILTAAGAAVREAVTGAEALKLAAGCGAVVLDVNLPDMDGFSVCRALRSDPATALLPVVHLSAQYLHDADKAHGLDAGADAYLTHPVDPGVLVATINALLRARRAEQEARDSRAHFEAVFRSAPVGIVVMTRDGRVVDSNAEFRRLLDCRDEDLRAGCLPAALRDAHARAAAGPQATAHWSVSMPHPRDAREALHIDWHLAGTTGDTLVMMAVDDSARRGLEVERERLHARELEARGEAEDANRAKDTFLAMLSHELRNPLNTISVWTGFLRNPAAASRLQEGLDAIARSVALQGRLVGDLLDVSRIATGKLTLASERMNPVQVIGDVVMSLDVDAAARGVQVVQSLEPALEIWADPARLHQIAWNLVSNAIKFSREGGRVDVRLAREGEDVVLRVADAGAGIAPDFLPYVFDRFTQGARVSAQAGLGLGLAIVKALVEMQGGHITVASPGVGQGTSFEVRFPVAGRSAVFELGQEAGGARPLVGRTILVVDDSEEMRRMLALVLRQYGAEVTEAATAEQALQALDRAVPSLVLSDIGLPGIDGYRFLRELRAGSHRARAVPAIAVTAYAREDDVDRARDAGYQAHVSKPVDMGRLLEAIVAALPA